MPIVLLVLIALAVILFVWLAIVIIKWLFILAVVAAIVWLILFFTRGARRRI